MDLSQAIRIDRLPYNVGGHLMRNVDFYVFLCCVCGGEVKKRKYAVEGWQGTCRPCFLNGPKLFKRLRPYAALYNYLRSTAKRRDMECTLTYEQFLSITESKNCHYCAAPLRWAEFNGVKNGNAHNLDRKDSKQGYCMDNVVPCCIACNVMKSDKLSYSEMVLLSGLRTKFQVTPQQDWEAIHGDEPIR